MTDLFKSSPQSQTPESKSILLPKEYGKVQRNVEVVPYGCPLCTLGFTWVCPYTEITCYLIECAGLQTWDGWEKAFPAEKRTSSSQSPCKKAVLSLCFSSARQAHPLHLHAGSHELKASFSSCDAVGTQDFKTE